MEMALPRKRRICSLRNVSRSVLSNRMLPEICACGASSRMTASEVTDLPDPDSPTNANDSRSAMVKLTSRTAWVLPNRTFRSRTSSIAFDCRRIVGHGS